MRGSDVASASVRPELPQFDASVLKAIGIRPRAMTYVIRNMMAWPNDLHGVGFWPGLETSTVLRACRRLQKLGLIEEAPTAYAVMKCWRPVGSGGQLADAHSKSPSRPAMPKEEDTHG